ncbi:hypothetical protein PI124_g20585 [Phytophthora idaei]|nr:hypothetical protein PI125_g21966 [Phytophthora idaei]KAG3130937.1 hypothetical protein PI126_g20276 [Phytophthora idaei]KAG3234357.1 hypothetical protein PI124_g20585 [Phytophthora idaei]
MDYEPLNDKAVIVACALAHNFIRQFDEFDLVPDLEDDNDSSSDISNDSDDGEPIAFDFRNGTSWRNWMTNEMWRGYEEFRSNAPMENDQESEESSDDSGSGRAESNMSFDSDN